MTVTVQEAIATLRHRWAAEAEMNARAIRRAWACLPELARLARERGARRVIVFGSLVEGRFRRGESDIDLAVEGLPEQALFRLMADLSRVAQRHVDVVPIEEASPSLVARIRETGEEIA